jgi:hypothetical protein
MEWPIAIAQNLLASFLGVLLGLAFTRFVKDKQDERDYGGYSVKVIRTITDEATGTEVVTELVNRSISIPKAKAIRNETADLSVFLKGVASPYEILNCDLIDEGRKNAEDKVLRQDGKTYIINLDKNPPGKPRGQIRL